MRCYSKKLHISYKDQVTNEEVRAGNRTTQRPPDDRKDTQTAVVWSGFPFIRSGQNHLARHSERGKKTRQTEKQVGKQHQHWQGWDQFGMTGVFISVPRYDWCAPLSHPISRMLLNHGPHTRAAKKKKKKSSHGNEVLPKDTTHLILIPCYQRESLCQDQAGNQITPS